MHTVREGQCSVTPVKNHQQTRGSLIDEQTTDIGGAEPGGVTHKWIGDDPGDSVGDKDGTVIKMTPLIYVIAFASMGLVGAEVVDLKCSDNATCINSLPRELYNNIKHHKTVRLFDVLTIEPLKNRQARSNQGPLTRLLTSHAISFNWNDLTFRFSNPEDKYDSMDLEVFENRSSKGEWRQYGLY